MNNLEIREMIRKSRFKHYEIAQKIGISESAFSRWLRDDLTDTKKEKIISAISELQQASDI